MALPDNGIIGAERIEDIAICTNTIAESRYKLSKINCTLRISVNEITLRISVNEFTLHISVNEFTIYISVN